MQGKIFGIPLVLILLVVAIAGLVDLPMYYMTQSIGRKVDTAVILMNESNATVKKVLVIPTPVVTPVPTVKPVKVGTTSAVKR